MIKETTLETKIDIYMELAKLMGNAAMNGEEDAAIQISTLANRLLLVIDQDRLEIKQEEALAKQAFITTFTGKKFFAYDPQPEQISLKDISTALSKNNRFTGHSRKNYTVGEHSLHCYELLRKMGSDRETCLMGLLHDASEAYLQDIASPFKRFLSCYKIVEEIVQNAVYMKYLGFVPTDEQYAVVKMVDGILLINEIDQLMPVAENVPLPDVPRIFVNVKTEYPQDYIAYMYEELANHMGAID